MFHVPCSWYASASSSQVSNGAQPCWQHWMVRFSISRSLPDFSSHGSSPSNAGTPKYLDSSMKYRGSLLHSPGGSTALTHSEKLPPAPCAMRKALISVQWHTGSRMSAAPDVGECHRLASNRKSSMLSASQL